MRNNRLCVHSVARFVQVALGVALVIGAVASGAAATNPVPAIPARAAQVHVAIVAKGDVGQYAGMCGSRAGTDSLDGILELKDLGDDGTALYAGKLIRVTEVDACGTKPAPTEDQVAMCFAHLSGRAPMDVTLEVYEDDRGAWVKSEPATPLPSETVRKQISGCPEPGEWLDAYPKDGWMSGLGLETVPSGPLGTGTYTTENLTLTVF
jgi:hypothetical protein